MKTIQEDDREILSIEFGDCGYDTRSNCTDIEPYQEKGIGDWMTVLAVKDYSGDVIARIPAWRAEIYYV